MPEIFVDADACPVKAEVETVATRHGLVVHIVSNGGIRPSANPLLRTVIVDGAADAADDWIADHIQANDIAITADIPLASRCLKKGASVLGPTGKPFTEESIGMALGMRDLHRHLREATGAQTFTPDSRKPIVRDFLMRSRTPFRRQSGGLPRNSCAWVDFLHCSIHMNVISRGRTTRAAPGTESRRDQISPTVRSRCAWKTATLPPARLKSHRCQKEQL